MDDRPLTPLGRVLEHARKQVLQISAREAARRAGISDARWHQVVTGHQAKGGKLVQVNPRATTVVAMALAVRADPAEALQAAGIPASPESITAMATEAGHTPPSGSTLADDDLVAEIQRVAELRISPSARIRMIAALVQEASERDTTPVRRTA